MDKSGSRYKLRELVINDSTLVSLPRKLTELSFTAFCWGVWTLLWIPLISLIAWFFGFSLLSHTVVTVTDFSLQVNIFLIAIIILLLIFNWGIYTAYQNGKETGESSIVYYRSDQTKTNDFFQFDNQDANQLKESQMVRFGFEHAEEIPSFVVMVDGKKIIKKQRKLKSVDK